jgi:hypothetical protein
MPLAGAGAGSCTPKASRLPKVSACVWVKSSDAFGGSLTPSGGTHAQPSPKPSLRVVTPSAWRARRMLASLTPASAAALSPAAAPTGPFWS